MSVFYVYKVMKANKPTGRLAELEDLIDYNESLRILVQKEKEKNNRKGIDRNE